MKIKQRFQRWLKFRFAIIYPFGIFLAFFAKSDDASIRSGIGWIITGLALRLWANGYAIKMDKLTTSGPYAFVRNPLYLGTIFIAVGFVIMLKTYYLGTLFIALMLTAYRFTIKKEEKMLEAKFQDEYLAYKRRIQAMIPSILPYPGGEKWPFSFKRLIESKEYKTLLWIIIVIIAFHLKDEFMTEGEKINIKNLSLIIAAFILGCIDFIGEAIKSIRKSK